MYKKTQLDNGLRIITYRMPKMQSVAVGIWIKIGGRYETAEEKGISHYLEHLLFKGSKKYSCRKIKESIEGVGGSLNGFTSEELTCYLAKLPSRYLGLGISVLSDMVLNPLLSQADIDKERTVILEEIKMYKDLPQSYVHDLLDELLWPAQPLGSSIIGSAETVSRLNKKEISAYKRQHYTPANIVVAVTGALEDSGVIEMVKKYFSCFQESESNIFLKAEEKQHKPQVKLFTKDTEQTHLALGFHGFKREHPYRYALGLLHIILGANMSSRLFEEVREKRGLAYEIGTQVKRFHDTGAFIIHAGIDNSKVNEAIKVILAELNQIRHNLVALDEFKRAKEFFLGQLMLALEDTLDHMFWIGEQAAANDKTYTLNEVIKQVNKIKREDILEVAGHIFKEKSLNLALIGPLKEGQDSFYNQLHLD